MRSTLYAQLHAIARRESRDNSVAEDVVQEALLAAVLTGRTEFEAPETARWLTGTVRNQARMIARSASRRRRREGQWLFLTELAERVEQSDTTTFLAGLPKSLKAVAALTLSGHNRREIAYLLGLSDTALRQRIVALKRKVVQAGLALPSDLPGLGLDIAYGRVRDTLLPALLRHGGVFASHDPDGHIFLVRRSQNADRRQQAVQLKQEGSR
ncbi:RNA polymerase sigma factor [Chelativorans sp. M5D2P16]|uniref:RNA polymerase sigma factor n=1 Tax=Chelativorans sp. M5D2P16 TaxID=3095678 RepID=UPI002AC9FA85|nr:sigma factor [Chelativorans sp. M5D2P16]MDZ5697060.1 sigma factor [Chelativorans sp. M5D2P16]